jgi:hypothetical protein
MTAQPKPQVEATDEANDFVEELTDKAIENEIRKLDRMIEARSEAIAKLQAKVLGFTRYRALLVEQKIKRLKEQLPKPVETDEPEGDEQ